MSKTERVRPQAATVRGGERAVQLADDQRRLVAASAEQLGVASAFVARAMAQFDAKSVLNVRDANSLRRLREAGKTIGEELRRRCKG